MEVKFFFDSNFKLRQFITTTGIAAAGLVVASGIAFGKDSVEEEITWDIIVERDIMIPMRDGVKLATDFYFPAENGHILTEKLPVVLLRTPYNKESRGNNIIRFFAQPGYLSVVQDCRGHYKSEGDFFPFRDDPEDGYDTIEWLARHPSCNGKVGMHRPFHMAWVQFHAATKSSQSCHNDTFRGSDKCLPL